MLQAPVFEEIKGELNERIAQLEAQLAKKDAQIAHLIREVRQLKAEQKKRNEEFSTTLEALKQNQFHKPPSQYPPYEKEAKASNSCSKRKTEVSVIPPKNKMIISSVLSLFFNFCH